MTETIPMHTALKNHIRNSKDLNQKVVAARMGVSEGYLSDLLAGSSPGNMKRWEDMATACGTFFVEIASVNIRNH